jgi:crossover junction endodeoxyribonuclease RusA
MTTLTLPWPPSANRLWRNVNGRTIKSETYRNWLVMAGWDLKSQRPSPVKGRYRMTVVAVRPDQRRRDLDNLLKPISDLLKECGVIEDDSLAQSLTAGWSMESPVRDGQVIVSIEPVVEPVQMLGRAA